MSVKVVAKKLHIKRPPNVWLIYRIVKMREYFEAHPGEKHNLPQMSQMIAQQWRNESEEVITYFKGLAKQKALEHLALHPNYRYRPRPKGSINKQQPKTVERGTVTKPGQTRKAKAASTSTIAPAPTRATNVPDGEWLEAYNLAPASNDVVGLVSACDRYAFPSDNGVGLDQYTLADSGVALGSAVAPIDQYAVVSDSVIPLTLAMTSSDKLAVVDSNDAFYDVPISSPNTFGAQPTDYYGQPYQPYTSYTTMQPFAASQVDFYQTAELSGQMDGGDSIVYEGQLYAGDGVHQPSYTHGANYMYQQTTELDVAAVPRGAYSITYSQNEVSYSYTEAFSTGFANAVSATDYEHAFFDYNWNNSAEFMAVDQEVQLTWDAVSAAVAAGYADLNKA